MASSIASLERGEYQPVTTDNLALDAPTARQSAWRRPALLVGLTVGAMVIVGTAVVAFHGGSEAEGHSGMTKGKLHKTEEKLTIDQNSTYATAIPDENPDDDEYIGSEASIATTVITTTTTATTVTTTTTTGTVTSTTTVTTDLLPDEIRHDGNDCEEHEEDFLGLCYKTCDELTNGLYPVRNSPFHCCKNHDCLEHEQVRSWIPCEGYNVNAQDGCPKKPGACLVDEELLAGLCYKKCSILTHGSHPYRSAPATCCKDKGLICLDFIAEDVTSGAFAVGGGQGDGHSSTPGRVHGPIHHLTEGSALVAPALYAENLTNHNHVPDEHRHDGNQCEDNEEILAGLCYKKCSILTNGEYPQRSTAFTCCKTVGCLLHQSLGADWPTPCHGYDVSGHDTCPHPPGGCLDDEELFLGLCYAKCDLLTTGQYPYRVAPLTCCKMNDEEKCLDPSSDDDDIAATSSTYEIAGGGDDNNGRTPGHVHGPLRFVTEQA